MCIKILAQELEMDNIHIKNAFDIIDNLIMELDGLNNQSNITNIISQMCTFIELKEELISSQQEDVAKLWKLAKVKG